MAITHQGTGTRGAGTTTTTPTLSGGAAGRLALAGRTVKPSTATATTEAGWNQKVNATGGTGSQGIDTGPQRMAIDTRVLYGSDSNPTFDQGSSPNATSSVVSIYSAGTGKLIYPQFSNGDDNTHGAGRSATSGTVSLEVDDVIWVYAASDTDFNTGGWTGATISVSAGAVGSTTEQLAPGGSSTGQDVGNAVYEATVTTAAASATITFSTNADGQANCGQVGFAVLRESQMSYSHLLTATTAETFGTGSHTTASFTPGANSLLVVCVSVGNSASGTDIQGNLSITDSVSLTYTSRVTNQENAATGVSSYCSRIYTAPVGGSPSSMTLTFDCGAVNVFAYHYSVLCITGYDTGTPTGATGSIDNNGTGALTLTLGAAPSSTSFVVGYLFSDVNAAGTAATLPGADFTEVGEAATSTPNQWVQSELRTGSTSTSVEWTDTDAGTATTFYRNAVALEIKAAAAGSVTGTAAVTQADDTSTASGWITVAGTVARTQDSQISAASGTVHPVGTAAVTQANQVSTATGQLGYAGSVGVAPDIYDAGDTSTPPTDIVDSGDTATPPVNFIDAEYHNQTDHTSTATGQLGYSGTLAETQDAQTSTASGSVSGAGVSGSAAATQDNQTSSAAGTVHPTGTITVTQTDQTSTATGQLGYSGTSAVTQANQTSAAAGVLSYVGTSARTQANQTSTATGVLGYSGTLAETQDNQIATASGSVAGIGEISGSVAATQANQTATASGKNGFNATVTVTQANQIATASGWITIIGTLAETQDNQSGVATGKNGFTGTLARTQANQTATAAGWITVTGLVAATQSNQIADGVGFVGEIPVPAGIPLSVPVGSHAVTVTESGNELVVVAGSHVVEASR